MYQEMADNLRTEIQTLRKAREMSVGQIAEAVDIPSAEFNEFETAGRMVRSDELMRISSALEIPLLRLFGAPER